MQKSEKWYCARTKPSQDQVALENLKRQKFNVYYPFETIERIRNGRIVRGLLPVFPSYILIQFTLEGATWRAINSTRGIVKLISFRPDGVPSAADSTQIELLQKREKAGELCISGLKRIRRNDLVKLKYGLDTTSVGVVVRTRQERVEFLLNCFGRQTCVTAPRHALEVVGHATA